MTDEHSLPGDHGDQADDHGGIPDEDASPVPPSTEPPSTNGSSPGKTPAVRSGLARRRNPALATLGELAQGARKVAFRDPIALFLLIASIVLAIAFATLLGDIKPSSAGTQAPLSTVQKLAKRHEISNAVLLDHDNRVEVTSKPGATIS